MTPGRGDILQGFLLRCDNVGKGCEWKGTVDTLDRHVATCGFGLVPCPKGCRGGGGMVKKFLKKDIENHIARDCPNRDVACKRCGKKGTHWGIANIHDPVCPKKPTPCTNDKCTRLVLYKDLEEHVSKDCPYSVITCKYKNIGCRIKMERRKMAEHEEDDEVHLHMALEAVVTLHDTVQELKDTLARLQ
jgi:hypothetical protein